MADCLPPVTTTYHLPTRPFVVSHHVRVLSAVAAVVDAGVPVYFVGGNHDAQEFGGAMLRDELGVTLLEEPARLTLAGRRTLVMHGDGVWPAPRGYPAYLKRHPILRSRAFRFAAERLAHVDRIYDRVAAWSGTRKFVARHARGESTGPKPSAGPIEAWARAALAAEPDRDLVLAGHSHLPTFVEAAPMPVSWVFSARMTSRASRIVVRASPIGATLSSAPDSRIEASARSRARRTAAWRVVGSASAGSMTA